MIRESSDYGTNSVNLKMRTKGYHYDIKQSKSLQPGQLRGQIQVAVVENTPAGADGIRR